MTGLVCLQIIPAHGIAEQQCFTEGRGESLAGDGIGGAGSIADQSNIAAGHAIKAASGRHATPRPARYLSAAQQCRQNRDAGKN